MMHPAGHTAPVAGAAAAAADGGQLELRDRLRIMAVGATGKGKSSLGNALTGRLQFKIGESYASETLYPSWGSGDLERLRLRLDYMDTAGLGDSRESIADEDLLRQVGGLFIEAGSAGVDAIIMVMNVTDMRFDKTLQSNMLLLHNFFGRAMWDHCIFVFTFCDPGCESMWARQRDDRVKRESFLKEFRDFLVHAVSMSPINKVDKATAERWAHEVASRVPACFVSSDPAKLREPNGWTQCGLDKLVLEAMNLKKARGTFTPAVFQAYQVQIDEINRQRAEEERLRKLQEEAEAARQQEEADRIRKERDELQKKIDDDSKNFGKHVLEAVQVMKEGNAEMVAMLQRRLEVLEEQVKQHARDERRGGGFTLTLRLPPLPFLSAGNSESGGSCSVM